MIHLKKIRKTFCLVCLLVATLALTVPTVGAAEAEAPLSPGLLILAQDAPMAMAGRTGGEIAFEKDDFARAMNLASVRSVTITETPPISNGELRLGNVVLNSAQTISAASLSLLTYVPAREGVSTSSFRFTVNSSPVEMTCYLYMLDAVNHAPTLKMVPKTALTVSTHQNITLWGELPSYDPDGDKTEVEIVSYPSSGFLILTDKHAGTYTYTPGVDQTGKDSFTYVVRDMYGNYSASATVSLSVVKPSTSVVYADLTDSAGYNAALTVTEAGLMSGIDTQKGTHFQPDLTVSRGEFLVLAMKAVGIDDPGTATKSVFADEADLSAEERNYVAAAYRLGYVKGEESGGRLCFFPDRAITRAEAAVILGRMLNASAPTVTPTFTDAEEIPAFAEASIYSMTSLGILDSENGSVQPLEQVTRLEAAEMLCALMVHNGD